MTELETSFKQIFWLCYILPVSLIVIGLPLAFERVAPNGTYGFRTPEAMADPNVWYAVNKAGGIAFVIFGLLCCGFLYWLQKRLTLRPITAFCLGIAVPIVLLPLPIFLSLSVSA